MYPEQKETFIKVLQEFDKFRRIRNKVNYYGEDISVKDAKIIIEGITQLRRKLIEKYMKK